MQQEARLANLCVAARERTIIWSRHFLTQLFTRDQPRKADICYILCDDDPEEIEETEAVYEDASNTALIWGILEYGRVGHLLCSHPPDPVVITAYWPDTEPDEWVDNYKRRVPE